MTRRMIVAAAVAGILGAGLIISPKAAAAPTDNVKCIGANKCKGQAQCSTASNECAGNNKCNGQGWLKMTEADCKKLQAKNKKIKMESMKG